MKIAIINHIKLTSVDYGAESLNLVKQYAPVYTRLSGDHEIHLSIFHRAQESMRFEHDNITVLFQEDDYAERLRWCDNPIQLHRTVASWNPDIVHMYNLGLPLHFRWLRNLLPEKTKLIGHHTGEHIWIQLRLFLQQFGLRTVDGFIFENKDDAEPWLKASVILPRQPVFEIPNGRTPPGLIAGKLNECYNYLLNY
jgi:hypothetical protein